MPIGMEVGLDPFHAVLDRDPSPPPKVHSPRSLAHVCYGQTAGWIKMCLGTEVGVRPGYADCVKWGPSPLFPQRGTATPLFGPCLLWPKSQTQTAGWIRITLGTEVGHVPGWGPTPGTHVSQRKGAAHSSLFGPCGQKVAYLTNSCCVLVETVAQNLGFSVKKLYKPQKPNLGVLVCKTVRPLLSNSCLSVLSCFSVFSVTLVYCGQTVGWIKIPLYTEVGLGPGHIVLDGDTAPPKVAQPLPISAHVCCAWPIDSWMDQDRPTTWYEGRPRSRRHYVRWGPSPHPQKA